MNRRPSGRRVNDVLEEENIFQQAPAIAVKRMLAHQIALEMKRSGLSKTEMANRMRTSRAALDRLLDPDNASITLITLERAAAALGKKLKVELT